MPFPLLALEAKIGHGQTILDGIEGGEIEDDEATVQIQKERG